MNSSRSAREADRRHRGLRPLRRACRRPRVRGCRHRGHRGSAPRWGRRSRRRAMRARRRGRWADRPGRTCATPCDRSARGQGSVRVAEQSLSAEAGTMQRRSSRALMPDRQVAVAEVGAVEHGAAGADERGEIRRAPSGGCARSSRWMSSVEIHRWPPATARARSSASSTSVNGVWARTSTPASIASLRHPGALDVRDDGEPCARARLDDRGQGGGIEAPGPTCALRATLMTDAPNDACSSTAVAAPPATPGCVEGSVTSRTIASGAHERPTG